MFVIPTTDAARRRLDVMGKTTFTVTNIEWRVKDGDQSRTDLPGQLQMVTDQPVARADVRKVFDKLMAELAADLNARFVSADVQVEGLEGSIQ